MADLAGDGSPDVGYLSTATETSETFFRTVYERRATSLAIDKTGVFWEAVRVAAEGGKTGRGQRIAVLDSGFDMDIEALAGIASPGSVTTAATVDRSGHHGTVVALLIHEVAPDAELLLLDVNPLSRASVGAALAMALSLDADIVNMSLEFSSDCPRAPKSGYDISVVLAEDPGVQPFLRNLDIWVKSTEPFEPGGCRRTCELCAALKGLSPKPLVVSAAGNVFEIACPACHDRCVGVGFEAQTIVHTGDGNLLARNLPYGFSQNLVTEISIPQPAGFFGTSFASPLIAGFAAVVNSEDFLQLARMPFAMAPISILLQRIQQSGRGTATQAEAVFEGFRRLTAEVPRSHHHWEEGPFVPCAVCSLFMVDWYRDFLDILTGSGRAGAAVHVGAAAELVLPNSAAVTGNFAVAARTLAASTDDPSDKRRLLEVAADRFRRAERLLGGDSMFAAQAAAVEVLLSPKSGGLAP
jgi:Subtilase family